MLVRGVIRTMEKVSGDRCGTHKKVMFPTSWRVKKMLMQNINGTVTQRQKRVQSLSSRYSERRRPGGERRMAAKQKGRQLSNVTSE